MWHADDDAFAAQVGDVVNHGLHARNERLTALKTEALGSSVPSHQTRAAMVDHTIILDALGEYYTFLLQGSPAPCHCVICRMYGVIEQATTAQAHTFELINTSAHLHLF
jgi:hypothetical protein